MSRPESWVRNILIQESDSSPWKVPHEDTKARRLGGGSGWRRYPVKFDAITSFQNSCQLVKFVSLSVSGTPEDFDTLRSKGLINYTNFHELEKELWAGHKVW